CDPAVFFGNRNMSFGDDPNNVSAISSLCDLLLDSKFKIVGRIFDAGSIDQPKMLTFVFCLGHGAVAGGAWLVSNNCFPALQDSIEQAGFTNICPPYDCDDRQFHEHFLDYNR